MTEEIKKLKTVSHSQFSNWFTCSYKWYRDYVLHEKEFEDNLIMSFGTAIHETIQHYLKTLFHVSEIEASKIDTTEFFKSALKKQVEIKKIKHTQEELDEFFEDGINILTAFKDPVNIKQHFSPDKLELLAIEDDLNEGIINNVNLTGKLDIVFREKISKNIKIVDFKTSNSGWTVHQKEDFTKTSQLLLYKALYSKKYNIPISNINVEFFILKRKLYDQTKVKYEQTRLQLFKPQSYKRDIDEVLSEFSKFVKTCFTPEGTHNVNGKYPKIPGKAKKNCKYCTYAKNGKCDQVADLL